MSHGGGAYIGPAIPWQDAGVTKRLFLLWVCVGALGCGDDGSPADAGNADVPPGPMPVRVEDLCMRAITVYCAANAACCSVAAEKYATLEECAADQRALCNDAARGVFRIESVEGGKLLYSQAAGRAAIDRLRAAGEACTPARYADELAAAFTGTLTEGATCERLECESGLACAGGTCVTEKSAGDPCDATAPCHGDGLYCADDGMCAAVLGAGAACTAPEQCESGACVADTCGPFDADQAYCVVLDATDRRAFER